MSSGRNAATDRMQHIVAACDAIAEYVGRGRATFDADSAIREAIVYQIVVLGEAKAVVSAQPSIETELPAVQWSSLAKMRDKITHHYWAVDREVVWSTAIKDVPVVRTLIIEALARQATD